MVISARRCGHHATTISRLSIFITHKKIMDELHGNAYFVLLLLLLLLVVVVVVVVAVVVVVVV